METDEIFSTPDFKKCIEFHGHICPGLAVGYKAAKTGMDWLKENRAEDEELVAIVETDACGADAHSGFDRMYLRQREFSLPGLRKTGFHSFREKIRARSAGLFTSGGVGADG